MYNCVIKLFVGNQTSGGRAGCATAAAAADDTPVPMCVGVHALGESITTTVRSLKRYVNDDDDNYYNNHQYPKIT